MYHLEIAQNMIEPTLLKVTSSVVLLFLFMFGDIHTEGIVAIAMLMFFDTILGLSATICNFC